MSLSPGYFETKLIGITKKAKDKKSATDQETFCLAHVNLKKCRLKKSTLYLPKKYTKKLDFFSLLRKETKIGTQPLFAAR